MHGMVNRPTFHPRIWRIATGAALLDDPPETRMLRLGFDSKYAIYCPLR